MIRRAPGWWVLAEHICERLTTPRADTDVADRPFERLLRESSSWSFVDRVTRTIHAAWLDSKVRSWMRAVAEQNASSDRVLALHSIGWTMVTAAATILAVQAFGVTGFEAPTAAVPFTVAVGGLLLRLIANRISAAGPGNS